MTGVSERPCRTVEQVRALGLKRADLLPEEREVLSRAADQVLAVRLGFWPKGRKT